MTTSRRTRVLVTVFDSLFPQLKLLRKVVGKVCPRKNYKTKKMQLPIKLAIGSGVAFVFIIVFGWIAFPRILKGQIKNMVNLKKGSDIRELYLKVPFALAFKIYVFNVTNPIAVAENGAKPVVQEIGPYVYDEWKEKVVIEEDENEDTMDYYVKNTFVFNKELSAPLTGDELITIPHPLIAALGLVVERERPGALSLANKALNSIYRNPTHPFLTDTMDKIFFSGVDIACNVTDFAGKAICTQLKTEAKDLIEVEPNILRFSILGPKNGTLGDRIKVRRGVKYWKDVGVVVEVNGLKELTMWGTKECNTYRGTDTTIFPPLLNKEEGLISYAADICRTLPAYYVEDTKYDGIPVRKYSADFGDQSAVKEEKCFCPSEEFCYKKGIHDMYKCVGAPMVASLPHFYLSDISYVQGVQGLNPNEHDHGIEILFESMSGSPLKAAKRLQFSLDMHAIPKLSMMKNIPTVVMPMFWVEEGVALNSTWTGQLKSQLFGVLKIVKITKWLVLLSSLGGLGAAGYLHFKNRKGVTITPVHKNVSPANDTKDVKGPTQISMLGNARNGMQGHTNPAINDIEKY